ncbi:MAG: hypothetical protein Q8K02_17720, partial [Flavobacterium sp.]|nr:hypothetical protein [Flavobacterium sp.]
VITLVFNPDMLAVTLCFVGIPILFLFKELYRKNEYYFYYNNGVSKLQLFRSCLVFNFILAILIRVSYAIFFRS